jgi:SAM-dependent methyltransferase
MFSIQMPVSNFGNCNEFLLRAVPARARRVLEVGCGEGKLGKRLKEQSSHTIVFGVERELAAAQRACQHLDKVFVLDIERDDPPVEPGTIDCILYGDVLEHLITPHEVLARFKRFLSPNGTILCSVPNIQHHSMVQALFKGDFQYTAEGLLDRTYLRFFTYSTFIKLLVDCSFAPAILDTIPVACPPQLLAAAEPLIRYLGLDPKRTRHYLESYQYIFQGAPLHYDGPERLAEANGHVPKLTFAVCVSDEATLRANLLSSPCLAAGSPHELLLMRGCRSAAEGLNFALEQARNPLVVCVHQDVYLPRDWPKRFWHQFQFAQSRYGNVGLAGVYGVCSPDGKPTRLGHVVDRDRLLKDGHVFPSEVQTLDELLLVVPKSVPLKFDSRLGFHFYGADICLQAKNQNLSVVALDALCFHNSPHVGLTPDFFKSGQAFAAKWANSLPLATSCVTIDHQANMRVW